jgi:HTH-type transcriptional regulator/antitoxin HigA
VKIKPIKTVKDYNAAMSEIELLWCSKPDTPKGDKLDVLITLVEAYERDNYPIDPPDPIDAIKFRMEQSGLDRKDLEPYIGSRGRVSEVLNRKRELSIKMIRELHTNLQIPLESLVLKQRDITSSSSGRAKARS